ncbi:NDP-sugDHase: nucleotide sugar dehydrogenase [compost metagenome]
MGLTFKENCPDLRNTKVVDILKELQEYNIQVDIYDPWISSDEAEHEYGITPLKEPLNNVYDGIVVAVAHHQFKELGIDRIRALGKSEHVLYDIKYVFSAEESDLRL